MNPFKLFEAENKEMLSATGGERKICYEPVGNIEKVLEFV
jgi:hypothetical protein